MYFWLYTDDKIADRHKSSQFQIDSELDNRIYAANSEQPIGGRNGPTPCFER